MVGQSLIVVMKFVPIYTERVCLRPFETTDLKSFTSYRNDPEVARYQSWESYTIEQAQNLFNKSCHEFNVTDSWYQLAIADRQTNQLIGDCAINFKDDNTDQQVEIGFTLAREHQGKGYAREAVGTLVQYLFQQLNKRRITATVDVLNDASVRLLESLRFRREAHFIENIFFKGSWGSEYVYALLASEMKEAAILHQPR